MWKNCKGNRVHNLPDNYIQRKQSKRLLNYIVWMFFPNSLIDSFTYKTIKVLQWNYSVLSTKDEEKIQSNIEVLFSFHLAVVLIETDTNAESIPSHFFWQTIKQQWKTRSIKTRVLVLSYFIIFISVAKSLRFGTIGFLFKTWVYLIPLLFLTAYSVDVPWLLNSK